MDGVVSRLSVDPTPAAEPKPAAGVVATETANGGVTVRREEAPAEGTTAAEEKLILGKFKDHAALEKAYSELEKKLGGKKEETPPAAPAATPAADPAAAAQAAGLDLKALGEEYVAGDKKLSEASMAKLAAAGISAEQVATYIAGQEALGKQLATELATVAGGEEKLTAMLDWAKANASADQKAAFDAALDTGNPALVKLALAGIQSSYVSAVGQDPKLVTGSPVPAATGVEPFASQAEMVAAMRDKRYKNGDRSYIAHVEKRISASKLWGRKG